jgi:hypothetical protein
MQVHWNMYEYLRHKVLLMYVCCAFVGLDNKFTNRLKNNTRELKEKTVLWKYGNRWTVWISFTRERGNTYKWMGSMKCYGNYAFSYLWTKQIACSFPSAAFRANNDLVTQDESGNDGDLPDLFPCMIR